jgi:hypothetical protein
MSLYELRRNKQYEIVGLLTTVTSDYDRISMHGVRRILLGQQAESVGVALRKILVPKTCTTKSMSDLWQKKWSSSNGKVFSGCLWRHFSARPQGLPGAESCKSRDERGIPGMETSTCSGLSLIIRQTRLT